MKVFKMAGMLMKAFRSKPVTLMYPDVQAKCFESTKGSVDIDLKKCTMCGICAENCPASAIETDGEAGQWSIQRMQCVLCGQCVEICPEDCLFMNNGYIGAETEKIMDVYDLSDLEEEKQPEDGEEPQEEEEEPNEENIDENGEKNTSEMQ